MMTLKLACLRQDHIINPTQAGSTKKKNEEIALMTSNQSNVQSNRGGMNNRGGRGTFTGRGTNRGGFISNRGSTRGTFRRGINTRGRGGSYMSQGSKYLACGEFGYIMIDCPAIKEVVERKQKKKARKPDSDRGTSTFFTTTEESNHVRQLRFILDSGTTQHITPYKELLIDMRPLNKQIRAARNSVLSIEAERNIIIELGSKIFSTNSIVENIIYTLKLRESLLSIACINDHGFDVIFKRDGYVWIQNEFGYIIAEGHREGNLFYMDMRVHKEDIVTEYTFKVDTEILSTYILWYLRMGHLGIQNLQKMSKIVTGLENVYFTNVISRVCEGYKFGRQCRLPFGKSDTVRDLMELVYS